MTHCSWEEDRQQVIREKGERLKVKRQRQKYRDGEEQEHKHDIDEGEGVHMTHCSWEEDRKQVIREKGERLKVKRIRGGSWSWRRRQVPTRCSGSSLPLALESQHRWQ